MVAPPISQIGASEFDPHLPCQLKKGNMQLTNINRQLVQNKLVSPTPNLSIMLPGWCNAKCNFCFWERDQASNKFPQKDFVEKAIQYLDALPNEFSQVSVTGGEPTISPVFDDVMQVLHERKNKFHKVVLTTNGVNLKNKRSKLIGIVDHINISRHHHKDLKNKDIFRTNSMSTTEELMNLCSLDYGHADICLNCVVSPDVTAKFCETFVDYAKRLKNVAAVNFRIFHNSMDECEAQQIFENRYGAAHIASCPVCRVARQQVRGMQVNWKYSILEPTQNWNGIYELVIQPNGKLTADWEGVCQVDPSIIEPYEKSIEEEILELESILA